MNTLATLRTANRLVGAIAPEATARFARKLLMKLDFLKPFEAHHTAEFTLQQTGDTTLVTWAMFGRQAFMAKVMCLFFNMDKMVGKDFESGLVELKRIAEQ